MHLPRRSANEYRAIDCRALPIVFALLQFPVIFASCSRAPTLKADKFAFETIAESEKQAPRIVQLASFEWGKKAVQGQKLADHLVQSEAFTAEVEIGVGSQRPPELIGILIKRPGIDGGEMVLASGGLKRLKIKGSKAIYSGVCRRPVRSGNATLYLRTPKGIMYSCPVVIDPPKN